MSTIARDLRYFVRTLGRQPGFAITVVLSLAIGIGANTVMFGVAKRVLLDRVAARDPESLVLLKWRAKEFPAESLSGNISFADGASSTSFSHPSYVAFARTTKTLSDLVAFSAIDRLNVSMQGTPTIARGALVSGNYYEALGVGAAAGRTLTPADDRPGAEPVAMLSHAYWRERFGGRRDIAGSPIVLNGKPFTIVGVEPRQFGGTLDVGAAAQIIVPLHAQETLFGSTDIGNETSWWLQLIGRRQASDAAIAAELSVLLQQQVDPKNPIRVTALAGARGLSDTRETLERPVMILLGAVTLVLLLACTNVAGLLLARATSRRKEIAVRMSLGASRPTLIRQLLTESIALSVLGGIGGLALAWWIRPLVPALLPGMPLDIAVPLDLPVLGFTAAVCLVTGIVFGLVPAFRATRIELAVLPRNRAANVLMVVQIALSLVLLVGCGLFLRSLANARSAEPGFDPEQVLLFRLDPTLNGYEGERLAQFYDTVHDRLRQIPGVQVAARTKYALVSGRSAIGTLFVEGRPAKADDRNHVHMHIVSPEFLDAMRIPLILGRRIAEADRENGTRVAMISQAMAKRYFPNENPIGKRFGWRLEKAGELEIVGVVGDARYTSLKDEMPPTVYLPYLQNLDRVGSLNFAVRAGGDPQRLIGAVREAVRDIDPNVPMFDVMTQTEQIESSLRHERAMATLTTFFGLVALTLSCIGLYGLMSYITARRTRETGVRIALGAQTRDIAASVLGRAMLLVAAGVSIGTAAAFGLTRYVQSMVFQVTPTDPLSLVAAIAAMGIVAIAASWIPARRASRVDPVTALRTE
jgi:predicted permease